MQSKPAKPHFRDLTMESGQEGREDCQKGWHLFAATLQLGEVLDVGAGLGLSKWRIPECTTQDEAQGLPVDITMPLHMITSKSYDSVTCFDVIEHVVEDVDFLRQLLRIARDFVFITTPNYVVSKAANGCHCREYTPAEFAALMPPNTTFYVGDGVGSKIECTGATMPDHENPHQAALIFI